VYGGGTPPPTAGIAGSVRKFVQITIYKQISIYIGDNKHDINKHY
jgi:hypothetical protein